MAPDAATVHGGSMKPQAPDRQRRVAADSKSSSAPALHNRVWAQAPQQQSRSPALRIAGLGRVPRTEPAGGVYRGRRLPGPRLPPNFGHHSARPSAARGA